MKEPAEIYTSHQRRESKSLLVEHLDWTGYEFCVEFPSWPDLA